MEDSILKRIHKIQVEILDEIVRICERYSLEYCLIGGTLLGAIRHKGFIPGMMISISLCPGILMKSLFGYVIPN